MYPETGRTWGFMRLCFFQGFILQRLYFPSITDFYFICQTGQIIFKICNTVGVWSRQGIESEKRAYPWHIPKGCEVCRPTWLWPTGCPWAPKGLAPGLQQARPTAIISLVHILYLLLPCVDNYHPGAQTLNRSNTPFRAHVFNTLFHGLMDKIIITIIHRRN